MEREHGLACHANIETSGNYCHLSMDTAGMLVKQIQIIIVMRSDLHANLHVDVGRDQLIKLHNLNAIFTSHLTPGSGTFSSKYTVYVVELVH